MGVIAHALLCGYLPSSSLQSNTKREVLDEDIYWKNISANAKEFVIECLQRDPNKRLSGDNVINHPWLLDPKYSEIGKFFSSKFPPHLGSKINFNINKSTEQKE